jgi:urea transport system ATP-binding protein
MNADERDETGQLLRRIGDERTIIVIEHDMDFVRNYAEWVTVMHMGKLLTAGTVEQVQADKRVQEVYLGSAADAAVEGKGDH